MIRQAKIKLFLFPRIAEPKHWTYTMETDASRRKPRFEGKLGHFCAYTAFSFPTMVGL